MAGEPLDCVTSAEDLPYKHLLCVCLSVYVKILHIIYSVAKNFTNILVENALSTSLTAPHAVGCMRPFLLIQQYNRKSILM